MRPLLHRWSLQMPRRQYHRWPLRCLTLGGLGSDRARTIPDGDRGSPASRQGCYGGRLTAISCCRGGRRAIFYIGHSRTVRALGNAGDLVVVTDDTGTGLAPVRPDRVEHVVVTGTRRRGVDKRYGGATRTLGDAGGLVIVAAVDRREGGGAVGGLAPEFVVIARGAKDDACGGATGSGSARA